MIFLMLDLSSATLSLYHRHVPSSYRAGKAALCSMGSTIAFKLGMYPTLIQPSLEILSL